MKNPRLLLIAGYFPPAFCSTGGIRSWNIAKHLSRLGWEISVITLHPSVWRPKLLEDPEKYRAFFHQEGIRLIYTDHRLRWLANSRVRAWDTGLGWLVGGSMRRLWKALKLDTWIGWVPEVRKATARFRPGDFDVIMASGAPFISFSLAEECSKKLQCPFVIDYRDLWTSDPHLNAGSYWDKKRERAILQQCSAVIAISPSIAEVLRLQYQVNEKVHIIPNGYDEEELTEVTSCSFAEPAIVYTGRVLPPVRSITPFLEALSILSSQNKEWRFHYYGSDSSLVRQEVEKLGLAEQFVNHGMTPRQQALSAVKGSSLALIITSTSPSPTLQEKGIVTGKVYEAIGLKVPLLVISPHGGDIDQIVEIAGLGKCFEARQQNEMVEYMLQVLQGNALPLKNPEAFSWRNLALQVNRVLQSFL